MKTPCKSCNRLKERTFFATNNQGRSLYRDETGGVWKGLVCRGCATNQERERFKAARNPDPRKITPTDNS